MSDSAQTSTRTGSCLCNNIRFELTGEPFLSVVCHCNGCKKSSGTSFGANVVFKDNQVKIVDEQKHLRSYDGSKTDSGQPVHRQFCGNCGSTVFIISEKFGKDILMVASGTVDDTKGWNPTKEIYCGQRVDWLPEFSGTARS